MVLILRKATIQHLISAELRRFSPDSVIIHPPDVCCRMDISLKKPSEGAKHVQTMDQLCV